MHITHLLDSLIDSIIDAGRFFDARKPYPNGCPAVDNKFRRQITPKYPRLTIDRWLYRYVLVAVHSVYKLKVKITV